MNHPQRLVLAQLLVALCLWCGLAVSIHWLAPAIHAQSSRPLPVGVTVQGSLADRFGEQWRFYGCMSDTVSIAMTSTAFSPYFELAGPGDPNTLLEEAAEGDRAAIDSYTLMASGVYTLYAMGTQRSARGDYTLLMTLAGGAPMDEIAGMISYGQRMTGVVESREGQAWGLHACAGDTFTVTMESNDFEPYLEFYDPAHEQSLAVTNNSDVAQMVSITNYTLEHTGDYVIWALGARLTDRGAYTLTLSTNITMSMNALTETAILSRPPTRVPPPSPIPRATATPTPQPAALCTVKVAGLNLRSGPGTAYQPPMGGLAVGAELRMLARNGDSTWIQVQAPGNQVGWVASGAQYVTCNQPVASLPVGVIPPTPTLPPPPTATLTPIPTPTQPVAQAPTPTPPAFLTMPGGGAGGDFDGDVVTEIGMVGNLDNPIFRDRMYLRMEVYDTPDNARVDHVDFTVFNEFGDEVYNHSEGTAGYCIFGGGEPNCTVLQLRPGVTWPDTNNRIEDGPYNVDVDVYLEGDNDSGEWNTFFEIDIPGQENGGESGGQNEGGNQLDLVANIVQIGPGSGDALVFQVEAFDPNRGGSDGDGIDSVDLEIFGPDGNRVYQRTEGDAHYCAFAGGEPDCNVFVFADNGYQWPDGPPMQSGFHTLRATVHAEDGRDTTVETGIEIQVP